jgi:transcriptional regulator with XRE-family HTH domain
MQPKVREGKRRGGRPKIDTPSPVDVHVGSRVRLRRTLLGMSQEKLGTAIGLTFQQVQKYERGANRIGASRLFDLSRVLDVPVSFFFEEMPSAAGNERHHAAQAGGDTRPETGEPDPMAKRETLELVRAYYRIPDAHLRRRMFDLAKALANYSGGTPK